MKDKLYIIGNGFDLHHGINSRYSDFLGWLVANYYNLYNQLILYYPKAKRINWWYEFENNLAYPDRDVELKEVAGNQLRTWGLPPSAAGVSWDINQNLGVLVWLIRLYFQEWVRRLRLPDSSRKLMLDSINALFLNFNYTKTLETLYMIPQNDILYIHGCADRDDSLELGHGENHSSIMRILNFRNDPDYRNPANVDPLSKYCITDVTYRYAAMELYSLKKDVRRIISANKSFFQNLCDIQKVFIFGHSLSYIDLPYYDSIISSIKKIDSVDFEISYYSAIDYEKAMNFISDYKIKKYRFVKLDNLMIQK